MPIDVGAGFAEMGKTVAQTAQAYTLEAQKADLEMQKVTLADQLMGAREEKGRQFQTSERMSTQQFTSGENTQNRSSAKDIAMISADAAVKSAGIHAGGSIAAAQIGAAASAANLKASLEQNKPLVDQEVLAKSITNTNAQMVQDARKDLQDARASGDPEKIKAAQQKEYDATYSSQAQVQQVSLYQSQAKILEGALNAAQTRLVQMQDPMKAMTPEGKALAASMETQVKKLQSDYAAAVKTAEDALKNLPAYNPPAGGTQDLNKYLKAPTVPTPAGTTAPASGLLNSPGP